MSATSRAYWREVGSVALQKTVSLVGPAWSLGSVIVSAGAVAAVWLCWGWDEAKVQIVIVATPSLVFLVGLVINLFRAPRMIHEDMLGAVSVVEKERDAARDDALAEKSSIAHERLDVQMEAKIISPSPKRNLVGLEVRPAASGTFAATTIGVDAETTSFWSPTFPMSLPWYHWADKETAIPILSGRAATAAFGEMVLSGDKRLFCFQSGRARRAVQIKPKTVATAIVRIEDYETGARRDFVVSISMPEAGGNVHVSVSPRQ